MALSVIACRMRLRHASWIVLALSGWPESPTNTTRCAGSIGTTVPGFDHRRLRRAMAAGSSTGFGGFMGAVGSTFSAGAATLTGGAIGSTAGLSALAGAGGAAATTAAAGTAAGALAGTSTAATTGAAAGAASTGALGTTAATTLAPINVVAPAVAGAGSAGAGTAALLAAGGAAASGAMNASAQNTLDSRHQSNMDDLISNQAANPPAAKPGLLSTVLNSKVAGPVLAAGVSGLSSMADAQSRQDELNQYYQHTDPLAVWGVGSRGDPTGGGPTTGPYGAGDLLTQPAPVIAGPVAAPQAFTVSAPPTPVAPVTPVVATPNAPTVAGLMGAAAPRAPALPGMQLDANGNPIYGWN